MSLLSNPVATWSLALSTNIANKSSISSISSRNVKTPRSSCVIRSTHQPNHCGSNPFEAYVVDKSSLVNRFLEEAVVLSEPVKLYESMRYSLLASGSSQKRVRAAVCIAGCGIVGGKESTAMTAACAVEMIHTGISVLSDLPSLYNNVSRWGKPTNHMIFGEDIAILAAHALVTLAFEHLVTGYTKLGVSPQRILRAVGEISKCMGSDWFAYEQLNRDSILKTDNGSRLERMNEFNVNIQKPDALLEGSLVVGAILGGGGDLDDDKSISELREFATSIGALFLMVDC